MFYHMLNLVTENLVKYPSTPIPPGFHFSLILFYCGGGWQLEPKHIYRRLDPMLPIECKIILFGHVLHSENKFGFQFM